MVFVPYLLLIPIGWVIGALINYLADCLPVHRRLVSPFCLNCGANFTLWNYLLWRRRCATCGRSRGWRTWIVELVAIGAVISLWLRPQETMGFWISLPVLTYFGLVIVIDIEHKLILHPTSLAGAVLGLFTGTFVRGLTPTLTGAAAGIGIMLLFYIFGYLFLWVMRSIRGNAATLPPGEEALGFGDVLLAGVLGLLVGWPGIIVVLILAVLLGGLFSLGYMIVMIILRRYRALTAFPYGPFLIAGAILTMFFKGVLAGFFNNL